MLCQFTVNHTKSFEYAMRFPIIDDRSMDIIIRVGIPTLAIVPVFVIVMVISIVLCTYIICLKVKHGEVIYIYIFFSSIHYNNYKYTAKIKLYI